jgi:acetyltransferase-like isoleucine patch superfamily enzyme
MANTSYRRKVLDAAVATLPVQIKRGVVRWTRYSEGRVGTALRHAAYRALCQSMGRNVLIFPAVFIQNPEHVSIGDEVSIHEFTYIHAYQKGSIKIGNGVLIASGCKLNAANHRFDINGVPIRESGEDYEPIVIGNDVWLGSNAIILAGVTIGTGSVVGAGAVVSKAVPAEVVTVGVPARTLRPRYHAR